MSHQFLLHDAEHAFAKISGDKAGITLNPKTQQAFADYVQHSFGLRDGADKLLALKLVGFEVEGKHIWVYQEIPIPTDAESFLVLMNTLQEVWPDQVNHINIDCAGKVYSIRLKAGDDWQSIELK